ARIVLQQDRVGRGGRAATPARVDPARAVEVQRAVAGIADDKLRAALDHLGTAAVATRPAR
ncbi:hypothetical protein, partial [Klebsiella quasipneumoniae]|uniref:hypothetical protein n=1 Tax=Klebsiella quasipneumoniae TaxID=1463165 RepID=UPI003D018537